MDAILPARSPIFTRALVEVALGYALIVVTIWSPMPLRTFIGGVAVLWISAALLLSKDKDEDRVFGVHQFWRGKWAIAIALMLAAVVVLISAQIGTLHWHKGASGYRPPMVGYLVWSLVQQVILQLFLIPRLMVVLRSFGAAVLAASVMFSMAHLPNPLLTLATLVWGVGACWLFCRYKSVLVVALIHFMFGACIAISVPAPVHRNMRVGLGYLHYRAPARAQLPPPRRAVFAAPVDSRGSR